MTRRTSASMMVGLLMGAVLAAGPAAAQQTTGVPGSPERHDDH